MARKGEKEQMWAGLLPKLEANLLTFGTATILATWVTALAGAAFTYVVQSEEAEKSVRGFLKYCFPSVILRHSSCRLDVLFTVLTRYLHPPALLMISSVGVGMLSYGALTSLFGLRPQNPEPLWVWAIIVVAIVVVHDFMNFYTHYLLHRLRVLWEFHAVHHAAEFLLPITNRRFHPGQTIFDNFGKMAGVGLVIGIMSYTFCLPVQDSTIAGLDSYFVVNLLSFYHLRHSHIPMRYGRLERHFMSPAQHQLHHSREERHGVKNFGLCFSWWDRWFGTIVYSSPNEQFALGLPLAIQHEYDTLGKLLLTPLRNIARMAWPHRRPALIQGTPLHVDGLAKSQATSAPIGGAAS
jgi:sterol desaturase/sphingolipid hydroxylase (fatty acid hydroxylase superfamily)